MAWSAPMTATTGNVLTAAQFNQYWRDNLLASEAATATTPGNLLVASAAHTLVERIPAVAFTEGSEYLVSPVFTTLTDLTTVTVTTGEWVLASFGSGVSNDTAGLGGRVGVDISGATTVAASDANSYYAESGNAGDGFQGTWVTIFNFLNPGTNVFDLRFRCVGGGSAAFSHRLISIVPF